jgi:exonuclease SbcC
LKKEMEEIKFPDLPPGIVFSKNLLKDVGDRRDILNRQVSRLSTLIDETKKRIQELTEYIQEHEDIEKRYTNQEKVVSELEYHLVILTEAVKGIEETTESLRMRVKPNVERYMGIILPTITSNRYKAVRLDEQYNLEAYDPEAGEYRAKEVFSGGTEDQFLLSMRLAFALALLPEVKGRHPEFLFLDEPLGSSDEIRRSGILELLQSDLSENFRQIFIISHIGGLENEVQSVIRLEDGNIIG